MHASRTKGGCSPPCSQRGSNREQVGLRRVPSVGVATNRGSVRRVEALAPKVSPMGRTEDPQVIDYVLTYKRDDGQRLATRERMKFLREVKKTGLSLDPDVTEQLSTDQGTCPKQIIKIHAPFNVLSRVAEKMRLKMPLNVEVNYILNGIHIPIESHKDKANLNEDIEMQPFIQTDDTKKDHKKDGKLKNVPSLSCLLMEKTFTSAFTLHEGPENHLGYLPGASSVQESGGRHNSWMDLNNLWAKTYRMQPLWKIRNYFGEKIAFYFAMMEVLLLIFILPALCGLAIFIYGLYHSISCHNAISDVNTILQENSCSLVCSTPSMVPEVAEKAISQIRTICNNIAARKKNIEQIMNRICASENHSDSTFQILPDDALGVFKSSLDNYASPLFGLIVCLWGTIFLEFWKRRNAELVYEWDVESYEDDELVRPEFYGTKPDPITGEPDAYYSTSRQRLKFALSFSVGILMVGCVFISVLAVAVYKTWAGFRTTDSGSFERFCLTTVISSLLNALSILLLRIAYRRIAMRMTKWENHRTQTEYNDALIIKSFAFQFANSYSPLFYIAFVRTNNEQFFTRIGLPGLTDNCGELNNCMLELSFQLLTLMIMESLPKMAKDIFLLCFDRLRHRYCSKKEMTADCSTIDEYILQEDQKPDVGDFTLEEYTSKVIQYGYQMLFAVSFPLGPLLFILIILFDMRLDARRLLQTNKRPIAHMAQDIGQWFTILELMNIVAVVTNGCLIAFTSEFGRGRHFYEKLAIVMVFEHAVFVVKILLSIFIPDVPQRIKMAIKREKYEAQRIMEAECGH
ncbi:anoctamin-7-like isoform X2 [Rhinoraja longicauda]